MVDIGDYDDFNNESVVGETTEEVDANQISTNTYIKNNDKIYIVNQIGHCKTGKHGSAKYSFSCTEVFGPPKQAEFTVQGGKTVTRVKVENFEEMVISTEDDHFVVMNKKCDTDTIFYHDDWKEKIEDAFKDGSSSSKDTFVKYMKWEDKIKITNVLVKTADGKS
ncbi:hypothetical protein Ciccas_007620 [Cichlidogyrus casuarinus]|uniref:Uncharacterized protein n=1 Tax=Cichlidogyrus casuarinus TaxID=1844966 RepID=A0ABD2Q2C1_9PLAT